MHVDPDDRAPDLDLPAKPRRHRVRNPLHAPFGREPQAALRRKATLRTVPALILPLTLGWTLDVIQWNDF